MERMEIGKELFLSFMDRILDRFDMIERKLERMEKSTSILDGDRLLDNQDLAHVLKVSFRTLQRYRSTKKICYHIISGKTFYKESDVHRFLRDHFQG